MLHIFSESRRRRVLSVLFVFWIQEGHKHTMSNSTDVNTFNVFVSVCANHVFILLSSSDWLDHGFILLDGSHSALDRIHRRHVETKGILSPSVICCPVLEVLSLDLWPLQWCFQGHLTCIPPIVWLFLTWLYHFPLSVKYRKRWKKTTKKTVNAADDFIFWLCKL